MKIWIIILWISVAFGKNPSNDYWEMAETFYKEKDYSKALLYYQKSLRQDSTKIILYQRLVQCQFQMGLSSSPMDSLYWLTLDPYLQNQIPRDSLASFAQRFWEKGHSPEALYYGRMVLDKNPSNKAMLELVEETTLHIAQQKKNLTNKAIRLEREGFLLESLSAWQESKYYAKGDSTILNRVQLMESTIQNEIDAFKKRWNTTVKNLGVSQQLVFVEDVLMKFPKNLFFRGLFDSLNKEKNAALSESIQNIESLVKEKKYSEAEQIILPILRVYPRNKSLKNWLELVQKSKIELSQKAKIDSLQIELKKAIQQKDYLLSRSLFQSMQMLNVAPSILESSRKKLIQIKESLNKNTQIKSTLPKIRTAMKKGDNSKALFLVKTLLKVEPKHPLGLKWKKKILQQSKKAQAINSKLEQAKKLFKKGNYEGAKANLPAYTGQIKIDSEIRKMNRKINAKMSKPSKSKVSQEKIREWFLEGISFYRFGEYSKALKNWEKVLKYDSSHRQAKRYVKNVNKKIQMMRVQ